MKRKHILIFIILFILLITLSACSKKGNEIPSDIEQGDVQGDLSKTQEEEKAEDKEESFVGQEDIKENSSKNQGEEKLDNKEEGAFRIPSFSSVDLYSNEITNDFFAKNKLTIVSIWTTTWPSCIKEIPALQEIEKKYQEKGVRVLGILADEKIEKGKHYMDKQGAEFTNILPVPELVDGFLEDIMYVPTNLIVNSKGELIGDIIVGAHSFKEFSKLIDDALNEF